MSLNLEYMVLLVLLALLNATLLSCARRPFTAQWQHLSWLPIATSCRAETPERCIAVASSSLLSECSALASSLFQEVGASFYMYCYKDCGNVVCEQRQFRLLAGAASLHPLAQAVMLAPAQDRNVVMLPLWQHAAAEETRAMESRSGAARLSANWKAVQLDRWCSCQQ